MVRADCHYRLLNRFYQNRPGAGRNFSGRASTQGAVGRGIGPTWGGGRDVAPW